jgi:hypothetical protein
MKRFGESDKPLVDYSIQTFVDFLGEFLRALELRRLRIRFEKSSEVPRT